MTDPPADPPLIQLRWFDQHCHLEPGPAGEDAVSAAIAAGVTRMITVGTDVARSLEAAEVAEAHPGAVWATAGIHPHEARHGGLAEIEALCQRPCVLAVGECGLDYYYDHSPRPEQQQLFAAQIELARRGDLPLVIHTRDAWEDTFALLSEVGVPSRVVFHCFTGGPDEARRCLDLGALLSFSGVVTFKSADALRHAAQLCPLDRLVLETDAPYLAPVPLRGRPNQPANLVHTAATVAVLKGVTPAVLSARTWSTTCGFYGLAE
ncbi:MAG: TatD family hydrolase [Acidimicrobiales bacterium]